MNKFYSILIAALLSSLSIAAQVLHTVNSGYYILQQI